MASGLGCLPGVRVSIRGTALSLALGACGGGEAPTEPGDQADSLPPQPPVHLAVTGTVRDSALDAPVAGAIVEATSQVDTTDFAGAFVLSVDSGSTQTITVTADSYEPFSTTQSFDHDDVINIRLRRLAPFVVGFGVSGSSISTTVYDLQGAPTVLRSEASVFVEGPGFGFLIFSGAWSWTTFSDERRLGVTVDVGREGAERARWVIRDSSGALGIFNCTVSAVCAEEAGN